MAASSTITLANTLNWANPFVGNILTGSANVNNPNQPALSIAQIVQETMLQPPLVWRWNRNVTGFVCSAGVQDYKVGAWSAGAQLPANYLIIDPNGNSQQITTTGTVGATSQPAWNTATNGTTNDGTAVWTNLGPVGGSPNQSYSFFWIENASVQDIAPATPKWYQIPAKIDLSLDSSQGRPQNISAQLDDGQGTITWRLMPVPNVAYPVSITMQKRPVVYQKMSQVWGIPDEYALVFQTGFLAWAKFFFGDVQGYQVMHQTFIAKILAAQAGLDLTQKNIFLSNNSIFNSAAMSQLMRLQQGIQALGV
jgi:hypothetical protein